MYFHWQNLNEKAGGRLGSGVLHGRAWWYPTGCEYGHQRVVGWSWRLFGHNCGFGFQVQQGDGVGFRWHVALPWLISLWWHVHGGVAARLATWLLRGAGHGDREITVDVHSWALWWSVWQDPNGWEAATPRWRHGSWHVLDALLGRARYSSRVIQQCSALVPMPERSYHAVVTITEATWRRPRWFPRRVLRGEVDLKRDPIPFPGKGENAWDCGEDACYGLYGFAATTTEQCVAAVVESVLGSRRRHGGSVDWRTDRSTGVQPLGGGAG